MDFKIRKKNFRSKKKGFDFKRFGFVVLVFFAILFLVIATPQINFSNPTPDSNTSVDTEFIFNVSIAEVNLANITWNWNGTNILLYDDSIVAMYNFDNLSALGENDTRVYDISGNGNNGTVVDAIWNSSGKYGGSFGFGGAHHNYYIDCGDNDSLDFTTENFTVMFWGYLLDVGPSIIIPLSRGTYNNDGWYLGFYGSTHATNANQLSIITSDGTSEILRSSSVMDSYWGGWHHYVFMKNGTTSGRMYIDGVELSTTGSLENPALASQSLLIGMHEGSSYAVNGSMDQVIIYNRALTSEEVNASYHSNVYRYNMSDWIVEFNQTGIEEGSYLYNVSVEDNLGNVNVSESRIIVSDSTNPNATLNATPADGAYTNQEIINLSANFTDNVGIKNVSFYIYNDTGIYNQTTLSGFDNNVLETLAGIVTSLIDGESYTWFVSLFDWADNQFTTNNRTINVDLSYPLINFTNPTPADSDAQSGEFSSNVSVTEKNLANITWNWNGTSTLLYDDSIILMYNFNNLSALGENDTRVYDISGNGNNGTVFGASWNSSGKYGGSYGFDGIDDNITILNSTGLDGMNELTISVWVRYDQHKVGGYWDMIVGKWKNNNGGDNSYWLGVDSTGEDFCFYIVTENNGSVPVCSDLSAVEGQWYHVVGVYNGTKAILYVDSNNVSEDSATGNINSTDHAFTIGGYSNIYSEITVDNLVVYNRSLSATEINASYHANVYRYGSEDWIVGFNQTGLLLGENYSYNFSVSDVFGQTNQTETRTIFGNSLPVFVEVNASLNNNASIDPNKNIIINVNVSEADYALGDVVLQWKNSTVGWENATNITMANLTAINSSNIQTLFNASFILPDYGDVITYRIFANDTLGSSAYSDETNLSSYYDCTWNINPVDFGSAIGWEGNKFIGNISINNSGDVQYNTSNCSLSIRLTHGLTTGRIYFDNSPFKPSNTYSLDAGENITVKVNASFLTEVSEENVTIIISEITGGNGISLQTTQYVNATLVSNREGPYLVQDITNNPATVLLTDTNFTLTGYVRNLMGDGNPGNSSFNTTINWSYGSDFINISGNLSNNFSNLTDDLFYYNNLTLTYTSLEDMSPGTQDFILYSYGVNSSGALIQNANNVSILTESVSITFLCYNISDGTCVTACGNAQDADCPVSTTTNIVTVTTGGGESSGGGGGGGPVDTPVKFEVMAGRKHVFKLELENKHVGNRESISTSVSGINKEYIEVKPKIIPKINSGESYFLDVVIEIPAYFVKGRHLLTFEFKGVTVVDGVRTPYSEIKKVNLFVVEVDRSSANKFLTEAEKFIKEMEDSGFIVKDAVGLLNNIEQNYDDVNFVEVKSNYEKLKRLHSAAFESAEIFSDLSIKIINAEKNGVDVLESKKLLYLAETSLNRGDYVLALERLKEARLTYALEVKGEFNLFYLIINNPLEALFVLFATTVLSFAGAFVVRVNLYKKKLKLLQEEEVLLLELMKVVQREVFENKHMSMEEYEEAMNQYEKRLGETIQDRIRVETKLASLMKLRSKDKSLNSEKKRILTLIRSLQNDYLNKGKIETRVYENTLKTYSTRLGEIEEQIAFIEAQKALNDNKTRRKEK